MTLMNAAKDGVEGFHVFGGGFDPFTVGKFRYTPHTAGL